MLNYVSHNKVRLELLALINLLQRRISACVDGKIIRQHFWRISIPAGIRKFSSMPGDHHTIIISGLSQQLCIAINAIHIII